MAVLQQRERGTLWIVARANALAAGQHDGAEHQTAGCSRRGDGGFKRIDPEKEEPMRVATWHSSDVDDGADARAAGLPRERMKHAVPGDLQPRDSR